MKVLIVLLCAAAVSWTQSNVATITGVVTDSSGAIVPAAAVTVRNTGTGIVAETVTNSSGVYSAPSLLVGQYDVSVKAAGFKSQVMRNIALGIGQRLRLDLTLALGEVAEAIEVRAEAAPLQQETAEVSDTITTQEVINMPLSGRNPYNILAFSGGVIPRGRGSDLEYNENVSINGSRAGNNAFVVDGAYTMNQFGIGERVASIEALQEVKILASTYSAEYGRTSGGIVTMQIRSGTKDLHGSLYEYHRNDNLSANSWENNARGIARPFLLQNEFGGTLGGPVPGARQRAFYFGSYEGLRPRSPSTLTRTIPDARFRAGDLSGSPIIVYDPATGQPFGGNTIPSNRIDPAAAKILALLPEPNAAGILDARYGVRTGNYTRSAPSVDNRNMVTARGDFNPTDKVRLFASYTKVSESPRDQVRDFLSALNTTVGPRVRDMQRLTVGYTHVITPSLINEALFYGQRDPRRIEPWYPDVDPAAEFGIARRAQPGMPSINFTGGFSSYGNSTYENRINAYPGISDIVSYLRGRHSMRFGFQLVQNSFWSAPAQVTAGSYSFNGEITGRGTPGSTNPVNPLADFLLGAVKTAQINVPQLPGKRYSYNFGAFFQDDWKATNRLTLNLGMRYEFETKQQVSNNVYSRIDPTTGQLLVAGRNASRNLDVKNDLVNLSPRLGAAYLMNDKTVIRSGFAVFHSTFWVDNGAEVTFPGWTFAQTFPSRGIGVAQEFTLRQGFAVGTGGLAVPDPIALFNAATVAAPLAVNSVSYDPNDKMPYSVQWNFGVQRQVGGTTVVDVAYVASRSLNLERTIAANSPGLNRAAEVVVNRVPIQQVRPFPRIGGFNAVHYDARSSFHSFQAKATRRFSAGFSLDANYTFSKNIDTSSGVADSFQIPWENAAIEKAISSLDRTHFFSFGSVYELPFGKGRPLFSNNRLLSAMLGDFQLNALFTVASGEPLTISQTNTNTILSSQRPNVIDPSNLSGRLAEPGYFPQAGAYQWLIRGNEAGFPFVRSSSIGIGNLGRNTSRGPGFYNVNLGVFRKFRIGERFSAEIRGEAFNAFNTVNFSNPNTGIDNANYGLITGTPEAGKSKSGCGWRFDESRVSDVDDRRYNGIELLREAARAEMGGILIKPHEATTV